MLFTILIASIIGSLCALAGGLLLLVWEQHVRKLSLGLVSFAVGSLLGATFFELLPEALEERGSETVFTFVIVGIVGMFFFEKVLKWYHCHDRETCDIHTFSATVLVGDAIHNLLDGVIIALSFSFDFATGIAATAAIFFHEVPQEIGDFGVLLHTGYARGKVIFWNVLTALATPLGALGGYLLLPTIGAALPGIAAFAGGTFIYIAISDLMPELRHKVRGGDMSHLILILLGLAVIWGAGRFFSNG